MPYVRVAVEVPVGGLFDYRVGDADAAVVAGQRIAVPFGPRTLVGVVMETDVTPAVPPERIRAGRVLGDLAPLAAPWLDLLRFCSAYYHHPLGNAVGAALPALVKTERPISSTLWTRYAPTAALPTFPKRERTSARLAAALTAAPCFGHELVSTSPKTLALLEDWRARDWIAEAPRGGFVAAPAPPLGAEQAAAVAAVERDLEGGRFTATLLQGVTGSGKTEVYLRVAARALAAGGQVLVLVPEINLTPRLIDQFRQRFPQSTVVLLHSGLSDSERSHNWLLAHAGGADVVLGTRLAVLASLPRLALIVVDEEHDPSFKQQEGMRYSARDLAVYRAKRESVPILLGSATPSLETFAHALSGRYARLVMRERAVADAALPAVRVIDLAVNRAEHGLSAPVMEAIRERLQRGEQSLVFLNRRGYAPVLSCAACGWVSACSRCSAYLVMHRRRGLASGGSLLCHHCGYAEAVPAACPTCGNVDIRGYGQGTQRLEVTIAQAFPAARVLRIDRDSTSRKGAAEALFDQVHAGEADILVGTQMLAKGHDFKNLTLVAAINVDAALMSADFRASERLFAQLTQVAGRAGRADKPGVVLIQTRFPDHPLFQAVVAGDYDRFARGLLAERERAGLPPATFQALLRAEASKLETALEFLKRAAASGVPAEAVEIYDPVPMSLTRLMNVERAQLLVESRSRPALQAFLDRWLDWIGRQPPGAVRWHIEVDPLEI
ncbi:MAG: primosomal protein N' [Burkholderiales bacterium]|nr:primosomal protein N' [Burkholderiales bacterium]